MNFLRMNYSEYIKELGNKLKSIKPYKVILFGSYAYGKPNEDSDIDLIVVTHDDFIPNTFKEHTQIYMKVNAAIKSIRRKIPIDLIVHTLPMHKKFIEQNSSFAREVTTKGKIIYEANNKAMA